MSGATCLIEPYETHPLNVGKEKASSALLLSTGSVLYLQVVDDLLLGSIQPADQNHREILER